MPKLEVKCEVSLWEGIVLTTQADTEYRPLQWMLKSGSTVSVQMEVPEEAKRHYAENSSIPNYYVNTKVAKLLIELKLAGVSDLDLKRLRGENQSEGTLQAHFESPSGPVDIKFQAAKELGLRIAKDIWEGANSVIRIIRINYGQYWLEPLSTHAIDPQPVLEQVKAKWKRGNEWVPLVVGPCVVDLGDVRIGASRQYLEIADWNAIGAALARGEPLADAYALISDANQRYEDGDEHIAALHLNSAMEAAVEQFLRSQLLSKIPAASLNNVLRENYDRLLNNWVLPLSDELNLNLRDNEWPSIKKIQELRREAGHPQLNTGIAALTQADWSSLVKDAKSAISKLLGIPMPKSPHLMTSELHAGIG
jgi:hypothetical protein